MASESGFSKAITALATLEEKLRRALGLAGAIGSSFEPVLRPVLITGDLREPGNSFFRGRHFAIAQAMQLSAGNTFTSLRFDQDCIVEGIWVSFQTAGQNNFVYYTSPAEAAAVATPTNRGCWIDRKTKPDLAPFSTGGPGPLTGVGVGAERNILTPLTEVNVPMKMMIPAGGALNFTGPAVQFLNYTVWGRIAEAQ